MNQIHRLNETVFIDCFRFKQLQFYLDDGMGKTRNFLYSIKKAYCVLLFQMTSTQAAAADVAGSSESDTEQ